MTTCTCLAIAPVALFWVDTPPVAIMAFPGICCSSIARMPAHTGQPFCSSPHSRRALPQFPLQKIMHHTHQLHALHRAVFYTNHASRILYSSCFLALCWCAASFPRAWSGQRPAFRARVVVTSCDARTRCLLQRRRRPSPATSVCMHVAGVKDEATAC